MEDERWQKVEALYHEAIRQPPERRAAFLQDACAGDDSLRKEVESLLEQAEGTTDFISSPALNVAAKALALDKNRAGGKATHDGDIVGSTISHYRILAKLGSGGMGVVYKAEDTKLHRFVALKFLPREFAEHPQAIERFQREARAASAADHPNICTIHEIGEQDGQPFIVMQFLEGQTLGERIAGRKLKIHELLDLCIQVADGLEAAHALGIVHRDIKPANIFITTRGQVKILDFGIAKLAVRQKEGRTAGETGEDSLTLPGSVLGTAEYMSPEQARGEKLDLRTDLFSFGSVLYQMATGRAPFKGASTAEILGKILHTTPPPISEANPESPAALDGVLNKALEKDRNLRYQHASEVRADLMRLRRDTESVRAALAASGGAKPPQHARKLALQLGAAFVAVALVAAGCFVYWFVSQLRKQQAYAPTVQLTNFTDSATSPALSPDGRMLTFIRGESTFVGPGQIYVKVLPDGEPVQLTHDSMAKMSPQFSIDGSRIAYTVAEPFDTWEVPVLGGEPRLMLANASGLTWIDQQHLLFSEIKSGFHMGLVTAGESRSDERSVYWPPTERGMAHRSYLSPDGKRVLLAEMDNGGWLPCRVVPFDGSSSGNRVGPQGAGCTGAAWSPDGKWIYVSSDSGGQFHIWRQRFPDGDPEQVTSGATEEQGIAVSPDGKSIITSTGLQESAVWLHDSKGERQISSEGYARGPSLSPDGSRAYYLICPGGPTSSFDSGELWVSNLTAGGPQHLFPGFTISSYDISPDGKRIVFGARDSGLKSHLWIASLENRYPPRQIPSETSDDYPHFAPDGYVVYRGAEGGLNFVFRVKEDGSVREKMWPHPIDELTGVSPDGEWFIASAPLQNRDEPYADFAFPRSGGAPVELCEGYCTASWDRAGKHFALNLPGMHDSFNPEQTLVFDLPPGKDLPPPSNFNLETPIESAKLRGVKVIDVPASLGPDASTYVFTRASVHRNLYRIPLP